ncbi:MAG: HAMP domain-containing sensor histidine kinase [Marmoricola sp.]
MTSTRDDPQLRRTSRRIGLQAGVLIVLCLVAVAIVQLALVERSSVSAARSRLADVTTSIDKPREAPRDVLVTITDPTGVHSSLDLPVGLPVQQDLVLVRRTGVTHERSLRVTGHEYLVRTERSGDRVIQAALDRQPIEDESRRLIGGLVWAGLFGVLLAALLAYWLAHRAVAPMAETIALQRRFVADASHELRTPLTLLSTRVQLLARKLRADRSDLATDVDGVLADTRSLTEILDELLISVDARQDRDRGALDLDALAREVVESAQAEARSRDLGLTLHTGDGATAVHGSAAALRRAILALVDNALDHAVAQVRVGVVGSGRMVTLTVEDDGAGIGPDLLPHIFDRFTSSREPAGHTPTRRHYGLGLSLVADVAHAHGGQVSAANRAPGPGALISLRLPARR